MWCWRILESPLDCKVIQSVHPKGNQPRMFIGRTDAEDEVPILWPADAKSWVIGKDPDAGKDWGQEEKGATEDEMVGWHHILCRPLFLLPPIPPSIKVLSNESTLHMRWPKHWSFSFNISPSNKHPRLTSFRIDWFNPLAVWGTPKSLLQHQSLKASLLWHLAFFMVHLSRPWLLEKP